MSSGRITQSLPNMSPVTRDLLRKAKRLVPPMLDSFHKGQHGRIAVIGGSEDYAGAPYFSAMASARLGCDMSHIICTPAAGQVIKTYSPNLMVHPLMEQLPTSSRYSPVSSPNSLLHDQAADIANKIATTMLPRLHVLVIGPGLGRDPLMQEIATRVMEAAKRKRIPVVLDADALQIIQREPNIVKGWEEVVLTPNMVEFGRLWDTNTPPADSEIYAAEILERSRIAASSSNSEEAKEAYKVIRLANQLWGPTIVQKGAKDYISSGLSDGTVVCDLEGGKKRSGGQGDTLTGAIATFLGWRRAYLDGLWEDRGEKRMDDTETLMLAVFAGACITRECSRLAFLKKGRSLQASDLTEEIHEAFLNLFGEGEPDNSNSRL